MKFLEILMCVASLSVAADPGPYAGIGARLSWFDSQDNAFVLDDLAPGWMVSAGYRWSPLASLPLSPRPLVEVSYEDFSTLSANSGANLLSVDVSLLSVLVGAEVPLADQWLLVGKLGAVHWRSHIDGGFGSEDGWAEAGSIGIARDHGQLRLQADVLGRNFFDGIWSMGLSFYYRF
jgi:hypothetical protein